MLGVEERLQGHPHRASVVLMRRPEPYKDLQSLGRMRYIFAIVGTMVRLGEKSPGRFALGAGLA